MKAGDQDSYEDLMRMEDKEIKFWDKVDMVPNNMDDDEWIALETIIRLEWSLPKEGIEREKRALEDIFKHLELDEINIMYDTFIITIDILAIADISDSDNSLKSRRWGEVYAN
jgi:hypothetical protein